LGAAVRRFELKALSRFVGALSRDERGAIALFFAGAMFAILGFTSFAIDSSYLYIMQNQLQIAADAAALAAARDLPDGAAARARARDISARNMPVAVNGNVLTDADVRTGQWNTAAHAFADGAAPFSAVRVTTRRAKANANPVPTFFASILGIPEVDLTATATAALAMGSRAWDIAVVQDVTASFGEEIADARAANQALLNCVHDNTSGKSLIGLVTHTGVGQVYGAMDELEDNYSALTTKISQLKVCGNPGMPACSGTNIAAGLDTAIGMLDGRPGGEGVPRAIILISDGEPNPANLKPAAVAAANRAHNAGYSVFTVFYNRDNSNGARAFLASLARGQGIALNTPTAGQLPTLLRQLCSDHIPLGVRLVN
jgi:Flp pilus assembly protein TadG